MQVSQVYWTQNEGWRTLKDSAELKEGPDLVIYFSARNVLESQPIYEQLKEKYPKAHILGCTSGGEILNNQILDNTIVATLIKFDHTEIRPAKTFVTQSKDSFKAGQSIGQSLQDERLKAVFILSDGLNVNGSELVRGVTSVLGDKIPLTGGLAGDGDLFQKTMVGVNETPQPGQIAAIGFYGDRIKIGHGSMGGWDAFGPERVITKSSGNVLYELDNQPALQLYKKYLGEEAEKLPGSALLFPLAIRKSQSTRDWIVRTVLSIDENNQSMTFAGDIPQGYIAQLMHGNFDRLVDGACESARQATESGQNGQEVAFLISCIGRKLLMGQHTADELQVVYDYWRQKVPMVGFYSYGEISPHAETGVCGLHNQTMTITTFGE
ncbi:MAG TPA: FIST N-terminal domain-containing protein [Candidatus Nitrosotenuis sp.]|jgi:hypothetical protein|nr:FIST N-terminal domain-containing protein [Candidatus Nitrosotenuis sp.]